LTLDDEALSQLVRLASGDARRALTALEASAGAAQDRGSAVIEHADVERAVDRALAHYDRAGDQHYDVISAFIKSIRGSDVDAALHYLARMVDAGEDPRFIARRLVISAAEDIGMADPQALVIAVAAAEAVAFIGMPEGRIPLAEAVIALATAPKSNAAIVAIDRALADVQAGKGGPVPPHLRDNHGPAIPSAADYIYPHNLPERIAAQQYLPDALVETRYYEPGAIGAEGAIAERLARIRQILDSAPRPPIQP
jgi:putative ATPase